jgi:hypothetical protein
MCVALFVKGAQGRDRKDIILSPNASRETGLRREESSARVDQSHSV